LSLLILTILFFARISTVASSPLTSIVAILVSESDNLPSNAIAPLLLMAISPPVPGSEASSIPVARIMLLLSIRILELLENSSIPTPSELIVIVPPLLPDASRLL